MCECRAKINEQLEAGNARLKMAILMPEKDGGPLRGRYVVECEKLDRSNRKALAPLFASYCPFCGERAA